MASVCLGTRLFTLINGQSNRSPHTSPHLEELRFIQLTASSISTLIGHPNQSSSSHSSKVPFLILSVLCLERSPSLPISIYHLMILDFLAILDGLAWRASLIHDFDCSISLPPNPKIFRQRDHPPSTHHHFFPL